MTERLAFVALVMVLVAVGPKTDAQQVAASPAEPVECSWARVYTARGRVPESQYWQRVCLAKVAEMSRAAAPAPKATAPVPAAPRPARSPGSPARPAICESIGTGVAPAAATGTPDAGQIRLGMTREQVVAACCWRPGVRVTEHDAAIDKGGNEQTFEPGRAGQDLLEDPYLSAILCSSSAGSTEADFAPPPAESRVSKVTHTAYDNAINSPPDDYLASLVSRYGEPAAQVGPDLIHPGGKTLATEYKWLFRRDARDRDCGPPLRERHESFFGSMAPDHRPCATQLTVRIISEPGHVLEARFRLSNPHERDETYDRHVAALNRRYGLHLEDSKTLYARERQAARRADIAEAQQREADREDWRLSNMTPMQRAEEQNTKDAAAVFNGIMGLGYAAAAADQALGTTGKGSHAQTTAPRPGGRSNGEDWAQQKEERRNNCLQRCEQQAQSTFCPSSENTSCIQNRNLSLATCRLSCP